MNASEELERGRLAQEVLGNRVYQDAMAQMRAEIVTKWQIEKDEKERNWLWAVMQAAKRLESVLEQTMVTGQLRAKQIQMERSRAEKVGRALRNVLG